LTIHFLGLMIASITHVETYSAVGSFGFGEGLIILTFLSINIV